MKISIKYKLFLIVSIIVAVFIGIFSVLYFFFYGDYVLETKNRQLDSAFIQLYVSYDGNVEDVSDIVEELEMTDGIRTTIINEEHEVLYDGDIFIKRKIEKADNAPAPNDMFPPSDMPAPIYMPAPNMAKEDDSGTFFLPDLATGEKVEIESSYNLFDKNFIRMIGRLGNGDYIFLSVSRPFVEKNSDYTATFLGIAAFISFLACFAAGSVILNKVSGPIIRLHRMAQKISNLDFSEKFEYKGNDEIAELAQSINIMSSHLERTINQLQTANTCLVQEVEKERKIDQMRKNLLINVSHELKTPLALIKGYAEGLRDNLNSDEESRNYYCAVIEDEADGMTRMIEKLLHLSRIETGNIKPEPKNIDLKEIIDEGIRRSSEHISQKGLIVSSDVECCKVYADPQMAKQVFINYFTNAIDHVSGKNHIKIWCEKQNEKVTLFIYNDGKRLDESDLDKIWSSFYKVDSARTRTFGGTGIGLSVVRAIAQAHNTTCGARNEKSGITFYFIFDAENQVVPEEEN